MAKSLVERPRKGDRVYLGEHKREPGQRLSIRQRWIVPPPDDAANSVGASIMRHGLHRQRGTAERAGGRSPILVFVARSV